MGPNGIRVFVVGATGNQGSAVAGSLLSGGFKVRALTRQPASARAHSLRNAGAEIIKGDLNDVNGFKEALTGVDAIFCVLSFENGAEREIAQGKALIDLAAACKIPYFIYSSVAGAESNSGVPHWESKKVLENYLKESGLSYSIIRPSTLFENYLIPDVAGRIIKGKLVMAVNRDVQQQFIAASDIGRICTLMFREPGKFKGRTLTPVAEQMDLDQAASIFSEVLGKKVAYGKLPMLICRLILGKGLTKMFKWVNANDNLFSKDWQSATPEFGNMKTLKEWVNAEFKSAYR